MKALYVYGNLKERSWLKYFLKPQRMASLVTTSLVIFLLLMLSTGCDKAAIQNGKGSVAFTVSGKLENGASKKIFLSVLIDQEFFDLDSTDINPDGSFHFRGDMTAPEIYRLSITPENAIVVVVDAQQIGVRGDARDLPQTYEVKGSEESLRLKTLVNTVRQNKIEVANVEKKFMTAREAGKTDSIFHYQQKYLALQTEYVLTLKKFVRRNPDSFVASYAAYSLIDEAEEDVFLDSMLIAFNKNIPDSRYVELLNERLHGKTRLTVGSYAPDVTLDQPDGNALTLSSLRGKYLLIDFWASWCKPCREENPVMVKLYDRYKDKGFEILGISMDESRRQWLGAIKNDGLAWRHVSDLKGAASPAAQAYNVQAIPMTVLLDKTGRILARNLRGDALATKLDELFSESERNKRE